ncbi:MAG TPA: AraC family transcriptional regulator [Acidisoma sp.]|uniref:AraC family transcriptional regulator n=1 Tax=Acidisoma sp. TaxID=1872115 RepID=UPI002B95179E|nr:AraC family transcriptional regulator [Acidisoma sp.]HTH99942.1 AraC family transcriptional regulator [Acidisoma sp.]
MLPRDRLTLARDAASGIEAIRARFMGHAYDLHRHDDWLIGVTDHGIQDFHCRGARRVSTPGRVILIEPEEAHDGQAGSADGFSYRMLYLPRTWLKQALRDEAENDPGFAASVCDDPALGHAIRIACDSLRIPNEQLRRDAALDAVLAHLRPHLLRPSRMNPTHTAPRIARRARAKLHEAIGEDIGADALARAAGAADRFQLARAFRAAFGSAPHAYHLQIRLVRARRLLAKGLSPAVVAADCGFADQSHLGRRFRGAFGITPGAYRALCTGVPDKRPAIG